MATGPGQLDGIDPAVWDTVSDLILAAHQLNRTTFRQAANRIAEKPVHGPDKYGVYLYYIGYSVVLKFFGRRPELTDVDVLVDRVWPKYSQMVGIGKDVLVATIKDIVNQTTSANGPRGVTQNLSVSAMLGALMINPVHELVAIRPQLAQWYQRQALQPGTSQ